MDYSILLKISIVIIISVLFLLYLYNPNIIIVNSPSANTFVDKNLKNLFKDINGSSIEITESQLKSILYSTENYKLNTRLAEKIKTSNYLFELNKTTTCYEIDNKPVIWIYWDKADKIPVFGRILLDSIQCVNPEFQVIIVHDSTLNDFWPDCPWDLFNKLIPAHKADVVRVNLLKRFGGIYMDIDTFPLESFYMYYEMLKDYDLLGSDWEGVGPIAMGFLGPARASHAFFNVWSVWQLECMNQVIKTDSKSDPFDWAELLAWIAGPSADHMIRNKVLKFYGYRGHTTVGQLVLRDLQHAMMKPLSLIPFKFSKITETPILFVHHSGAAAELDDLTYDELMYPKVGHTVFTYFVKCAMKNCYGNDENNYNESTTITLSGLGKLPIKLYEDFLAANPLPYDCYKFNRSILPKFTKT